MFDELVVDHAPELLQVVEEHLLGYGRLVFVRVVRGPALLHKLVELLDSGLVVERNYLFAHEVIESLNEFLSAEINLQAL